MTTQSLNNALTMNFQTSSLASATLKVKSSGAMVTFAMTWLPENDDPLFDPPPSKVAVFYRRLASATASAGTATPQDVAQASANATADSLSAQAVANAPGMSGENI